MKRIQASLNTNTLLTSRWFIAFWAVVMQTMLGTAYAWSIFKGPLKEMFHWSSAELSLPFSLMIFFLGVSAAVGGKFVDKAGVKKIALLAAALFGIGTLLTGVAIHLGSLPLLLLSYGVIAGIGNGLGYITPVAILVRWFPDKRGLITGIAVMGFGFGAGFIGQIAPFLIGRFGLEQTFYIFGLLYLVLMSIAALNFANPPAKWAELFAPKKTSKTKTAVAPIITLSMALRAPQFYILWLTFFINIATGVSLLSNLSPLAQERFSITAVAAGSLILLTSFFNGIGRIFWSALSEKIGRQITFMIIIYTQIPFLFLLSSINNFYVFSAVCCYLVFCMGGGFATMPAFVADIFGIKNMGSIYGKFLLAWSAAGVIGPLLIEFSKVQGAGYQGAFTALGFCFLIMYIPLSHFLKPLTLTQLTKTPPPFMKRLRKWRFIAKLEFRIKHFCSIIKVRRAQVVKLVYTYA